MSLEESIAQGLPEKLSIIPEGKSVEDSSDEWIKPVRSGDGRDKEEDGFEDEGVGPESCELPVSQQEGQYQPPLSDFSGDSTEEEKRDEEDDKSESETDAVQEDVILIDVLNDHGLDSDDDDRVRFTSLHVHDHKRSKYKMTDLDVEGSESIDKATSFDFDVTKDHGLNSDSEEGHSEEDKEKEGSSPPLKKKKKFKPWKKLRRIFKKERKFAVDESQNKDESHQESIPSQLLDQTMVDEDDHLPVSTEEFLLSNPSSDRTSSHSLTSGKDTQNKPSPSRQRTDSDEGLPLSPDTPSLNFNLGGKPSSEDNPAGETNFISADEEERSLQAPNGHYQPTPSPRSIRSNVDDSSADFDSVVFTTTLNSDAAKHRISVKPSSRRPSSRYSSPQETIGQAFNFDVSSLSFASESFDEETEMEQKSTLSVNYKDGPMNPSENKSGRISGILDQLIEESKEPATEVETSGEVECPPSVSVKEETENVEEPPQITEDEERFTFRLPEDEAEIEDGDGEKVETVEEIAEEDVEAEKDDISLKPEENERIETKEEQEEAKVETGSETLVNKTEDVSENVEESSIRDMEKEETGDTVLRISPTVEESSVEEKPKEAVKEDVTEKKMVMKPSPRPRKKIPSQNSSPNIMNLNDTEVRMRKGNDDETKDSSNRALSVRDRISRLQMNAQPVAPVAPVRRSPRSVVTKPKPPSVGTCKVEDNTKPSAEKKDGTPQTDQVAPAKKTDPPPKEAPAQRTDPPTRKENKEEEVPEMPRRGGVKALIMRFQENQSQFNSVQRQAEVAS